MGKVLAFEEERFVPLHGQRIGKAIPKVEVCRVPAAPSEGSVSLPCQLCLLRRDWLDLDPCLAQKLIKAAAQRGTAIAAHHNGSFKPVCRREPNRTKFLDGARKSQRFRFILQNGNNGRSVEDHLGKPSSP